MISAYRRALLQVLDFFCLLLALVISGLTTIAPDLGIFQDYTGASLFTVFFYLLFFYILDAYSVGACLWPASWALFRRPQPHTPLTIGVSTVKH